MIKNRKAFNEHPPANADGIMEWDYIIDAIKEVNPSSKITPTDIDCVVERKGHYFVIESKKPKVQIPKGQEILLDNLIHAKDFTVVRLWGKDEPEEFNWVFGKVRGKWEEKKQGYGLEALKILVSKWFKWANKTK